LASSFEKPSIDAEVPSIQTGELELKVAVPADGLEILKSAPLESKALDN